MSPILAIRIGAEGRALTRSARHFVVVIIGADLAGPFAGLTLAPRLRLLMTGRTREFKPYGLCYPASLDL